MQKIITQITLHKRLKNLAFNESSILANTINDKIANLMKIFGPFSHSLYIRSLESVRKRLCRRRFAATPSGNVEPSV